MLFPLAENIWQTELDFIAVNRRNLVVLSVVTAPYQNGTSIHDDVSNSLEDDQDDDYYNDTMFTAVGAGSAGTDINNNMFDVLTSSRQVKITNRKTEAKAKSSNNVGVDFSDGGKTRYFELPDLINQNSKEVRRDEDEANNNGDAYVDTNRKNNNKFDLNEGTDIYDGRGAEGGGVGADGSDGEAESEGRIFVEHFDTKDIWGGKTVDIPQTTTAKTSTTTTTSNSVTFIGDNSHDNNNKNYDQMWDKLGTLGKSNSLDVATSDIETVLTTIKTTTTKKQEQNSSVNSTSSVRPKTATTTTVNALEKTTGRSPDAALPTTAGATATAAPTIYLSSAPERASITKLTTTTTQTTGVTNKRNNNNDNDNEDILVAVSSTTTAVTPVAHTQPTRTHHHHHHKEQLQTPQQTHTHATHSAKLSRKHHGHNRQHHRQRGGQQHNRRHHTNTAGGRSGESAVMRTSRLDTGRAAVDLRPSSAYGNDKAAATAIDLNRLDELDLSASSTFEQSINSPRGQNRGDSAASFETDVLDYDARRNYGKSTATISTTTRDSNIHIVKPEKLPEIIPSTPLTSNSKIIEIKTKSSSKSGSSGNVKRNKRMADEEMQVEIEPEYLVGELSGNDSSEYMAAPSSVGGFATSATSSKSSSSSSSATAQQPPQTSLVRLDGFAGMLQIFFGIEKPIDMSVFDHPPSAEFVNLVFALLIWCVRYPAVFWTTTKSFATIFSIQMIAVALDITFSYIGAANLYKLQVYSEAMPIQNSGLILNGVVTLALFLLSSVLMIASSMIMYLYGHGRLAAKMRDRSLITMKSSETWIYFAHCASLCYVLALAVVKAPLLNDLSVTYRNNLHCPTFFSGEYTYTRT